MIFQIILADVDFASPVFAAFATISVVFTISSLGRFSPLFDDFHCLRHCDAFALSPLARTRVAEALGTTYYARRAHLPEYEQSRA